MIKVCLIAQNFQIWCKGLGVRGRELRLSTCLLVTNNKSPRIVDSQTKILGANFTSKPFGYEPKNIFCSPVSQCPLCPSVPVSRCPSLLNVQVILRKKEQGGDGETHNGWTEERTRGDKEMYIFWYRQTYGHTEVHIEVLPTLKL